MAWGFIGIAAGFVAIMGVLSALTNRTYRFASGRISGVVGRMGTGKSLFVVSRVLLPVAKQLASRRGLYCSHTGRQVRQIVTNFSLELPYKGVPVRVLDPSTMPIFDELLLTDCECGSVERGKHRNECYVVRDALVVLDEVHMYIPGGKLKLDPAAAYFMSMARKLNCEVWWVTQSTLKLHKRVRDDTQEIWCVGRRGGLLTLLLGPSKWFVGRSYQPEQIGQSGNAPRNAGTDKPLGYIEQRSYRLSKRVLACYRSFDLIAPDATDRSRSSHADRGRLQLVASASPFSLAPAHTMESGAVEISQDPTTPLEVSDDQSSVETG